MISGTNLNGATSVSFGSAPATILSDSSTQITAISPAGAAGTIDIIVNTKSSTSIGHSGIDAQQFTYETPPPPPMIFRLSSDGGSTAGGTPVTITGTNLSAAAVSFGGRGASISSDSSTQITVTSPPHVAGAVEVTVTTPGGTSRAVQFTYVLP
jgi:hypothetical protein